MIDEILEMDVLDTLSFYNYETLLKEFLKLIPSLQGSGIDYQLSGNFSVYLKFHQRIQANQAIIQINLNENDLISFKQICEASHLVIQDNRISPQKLKDNVSDIIVLLDDTPFIEIKLFERLIDGTIILKDYYYDGDYLKIKESIFGTDLAKKIFEEETIPLNGYDISIVSLEYLSIQRGMEHDFYQAIDSRINKQKSLEISQLMQSEMVVQNIVVDSLTIPNIIDTKYNHDQNEIQQIKLDSSFTDFSETLNLEFLKTKQLHKIEETSESGFVSKYAIIVSILMFLVILLIILIILK